MTEEFKPQPVEQKQGTNPEVPSNLYEIKEVADRVRGSIEQNLNPEIAKFRKLFDELFVHNIKRQGWDTVSPLNLDSITQKHNQEALAKKEKKKELYNSLKLVKEAIEKEDGISEETYEIHKFAINSLARDLTNQRWWGSALNYLCEEEDREAKSLTPEQIARFPENGDFSEGGHTNIFDEGYKTSGFEGALFQREYENGNLNLFRLFHQGHRDRLIIATVDIQELVQKINSFVVDFVDEVPKSDFGLTLSKDEYLAKVAEFNAQFGDIVSLESENNSVVTKFPQNPQQLAESFVKLGRQKSIGLTAKMGANIYMVMTERDAPEHHYVDIFMHGISEKFDSEKHADSKSIIYPYLDSEFSKTLMELAISQKDK